MEFNELESKVLNYLINLCSGNNKRIEFNINDVSRNVSLSIEETENILISLMEKGAIKPVRLPLSEATLNHIKKKIFIIDGEYLSGKIEINDYVKKWEEIVDYIRDPKIRDEMPPLPPADFRDMLGGLDNLLNYIERLSQEKEKISKEAFNRLLENYNDEYRHVSSLVYRYVESAKSAISSYKSFIEIKEKEIEIIEVDERIKDVSMSREKDMRIKEIKEARETIMKIIDRLEGTKNINKQADLNLLEKTLGQLREEYELIQARALIEGKEELKNKTKELENKIMETEKRIQALKEKRTEEDVGSMLKNILRKAQNLFKNKLLFEENFKKTVNLGEILKSL